MKRSILLIVFIFIFIQKSVFAAEPWMTYPRSEEVFQVEIQLPKGQTSLTLNRMTELTVTIKTPFVSVSPELSQMEFDARMPDHNHGMLTKPKVEALGKNSFKVMGVKLHMEGFWELIFSITTQSGKRHKIVVPFIVSSVANK